MEVLPVKRDLDLVRDILLSVESAPATLALGDLMEICPDVDKAVFHAELMCGRGLIGCSVERDGFGTVMELSVGPITWEGYDYLDAIRSPRVWKRAKEVIAKTVGDTSLSVVKDTCKMIATEMVKGAIGV